MMRFSISYDNAFVCHKNLFKKRSVFFDIHVAYLLLIVNLEIVFKF